MLPTQSHPRRGLNAVTNTHVVTRSRAKALQKDDKAEKEKKDEGRNGNGSGIPKRRAPPDWKKIHAREERKKAQVSDMEAGQFHSFLCSPSTFLHYSHTCIL
jgi:ABC-type oligopeptide transport system ATPase subunit